MTRLKKIIKDRKITQKEVSKKSDVAEYIISNLANGKSVNIQIQTALKITKALDCTLDEAFGDIQLT